MTADDSLDLLALNEAYSNSDSMSKIDCSVLSSKCDDHGFQPQEPKIYIILILGTPLSVSMSYDHTSHFVMRPYCITTSDVSLRHDGI